MTGKSDSIEFAGGILSRQRHICAFFNGADEEYRVLRSFYKNGIDRGEKAFHIVDPELREEHVKSLAEAGINVQQALSDLASAPTGMLALHFEDEVLHLERKLMGIAIGPPTPVR